MKVLGNVALGAWTHRGQVRVPFSGPPCCTLTLRGALSTYLQLYIMVGDEHPSD